MTWKTKCFPNDMSGLAKEIYPQTGGKCVWLLFDVTGIIKKAKVN